MNNLNILIYIMFCATITINLLYKFSKAYKVEPKVIDIEVIDNHAQWVYDNKIYYANIVDGKVDNKTIQRIEM